MTTVLDGSHESVDNASCAACNRSLPLVDALTENKLIAALGVWCDDCDAITVLRYLFDPAVVATG
jgi:hypothetical protein